MDYKKIYENQYGLKKLAPQKQAQFLGLRRVLRRWDQDRYSVAREMAGEGQRVLDVGCGSGSLLFSLADNFREFYGLDIEKTRIAEAGKTAVEKFSQSGRKFVFAEKNLDERLDFPDDHFDAITCLAVIEHIFDVYSLVKEMKRVLKPGGCIIAEVPNIAYLKYRLKLLGGVLPVTSSPDNWEDIGWDGGHLHYFTMDRFCGLFSSQGFKVTRRTGGGFLAPLRNWWPALLTGDLIIKAVK